MGMKINEAAEILVRMMKDRVGTDDLDTTIRMQNEKEAVDTVLTYIFDTIALYETWARENKKHVCAACGRNADCLANGTACPIQEHYALPKDGFCHLWEERR